MTLACLAFPLFSPSLVKTAGEPVAITPQSFANVQPDAGSSQRARQMEAELRALQEEAAKDPARPTMAQVQRELNRMLAERNGDSEVSRLERRVRWSLSLALFLAVALCGLALSNLRGKRNTPSAA